MSLPHPYPARAGRKSPGHMLPQAHRIVALALALFPVFGSTQERPSIHMLELEAHRGVVVDYDRVDSIAAALPPPSRKISACPRRRTATFATVKFVEQQTRTFRALTAQDMRLGATR